VSSSFLSLALLIAAPGPTGLQKGDEFTFTGSVTDNVERTTQRLHREYKLSLRFLVLERQENYVDAVQLTTLQRVEDAVGGFARPVTGSAPDKNAPPSVRLDFVRVYSDGTAHHLLPVGSPLRLSADTPARALPPIPLSSFAPNEFAEFGLFPPAIPRSANAGESWTVAAVANRPDEVWTANKLDYINAEQCRLLGMVQHSPDWEKPVGGQTSWHRHDDVWMSTQDGTARKVQRTIIQRDGIASLPAAKIEVKYELKERQNLNGPTYKRSRRDVEVAHEALTDALNLIHSTAKLGPRLFEDKMVKLDGYLEESTPGSPYREAIVAARLILDAARKGNVAVPPTLPTAPAMVRPVSTQWPEPGQAAPILRFGHSQLSDQRGKPVVLIFMKPGSETTDLSLTIADALEKRYGGNAVVVPLATFGETSALVRDRDRLKLSVQVYDGKAAVSTYGVVTVPRFAVIDLEGKVKWTFTGVGSETGFLVKQQVDNMARPIHPDVPHGKIVAPDMVTIPNVPRP
jgi:hypothetical protein